MKNRIILIFVLVSFAAAFPCSIGRIHAQDEKTGKKKEDKPKSAGSLLDNSNLPKVDGLDFPSLDGLNKGKKQEMPEQEYKPAAQEVESYPGMVYISAGEFVMGSDSFLKPPDEETPRHTEYLEGFYIDRYEVTNQQYKRFIDATGHTAPKDWKNSEIPAGKEYCPVVNVSYFDAEAYAQWSGKRLPTEPEWEKAARTTDGRIYPWGNDWNSKNANILNIRSRFGLKAADTVGSHIEGISNYEIYDMIGNVFEWTSSYFKPYPGNTGTNPNYSENNFVIRGGSFRTPRKYAYAAKRDSALQSTVRNDLGFRCAK